jgi:hypothetical protein
MANRSFRCLCLGRRVCVVSHHDIGHPPAPANSLSTRRPSGQRELPVGSHGRRDRRVLRARSPADFGNRIRTFTVAIWSIAVAIAVLEAASRMYRGMHHPLDVAGGVVVGVASVCALVLAARAAAAADGQSGEA